MSKNPTEQDVKNRILELVSLKQEIIKIFDRLDEMGKEIEKINQVWLEDDIFELRNSILWDIEERVNNNRVDLCILRGE